MVINRLTLLLSQSRPITVYQFVNLYASLKGTSILIPLPPLCGSDERNYFRSSYTAIPVRKFLYNDVSIIRPYRSTKYLDGLSVCPSVCHTSEPCKND